ncbi:MAG TPA: hypothetical protein VK465_06580 [Fibrobacteria bacterium]|nr:hypothetical protein [Fibrobacteria bacterium]
MSARSSLPSLLLGSALLAAAFGPARAEDPFLGQIRAIKCVGCKPGWVTLVVHDPIELRDYELYLKDTDYNKIITPLPGKRIHERPDQCFYWMEKPKAQPGVDKARTTPADAKTRDVKVAAIGKAGDAVPDSARAKAASLDQPSRDSAPDSLLPPPLPENQGTPSACIKFQRQVP